MSSSKQQLSALCEKLLNLDVDRLLILREIININESMAPAIGVSQDYIELIKCTPITNITNIRTSESYRAIFSPALESKTLADVLAIAADAETAPIALDVA